MNTEPTLQQSTFSYDVFDRQLNTFYMMCRVLINGWEDYGTQEMNFDIRSLSTKASRLCYQADLDLALQHNDLTHQRKIANEQHLKVISEIVIGELCPFMKGIVDHFRQTNELEGHKSPLFPTQLSVLIPKIKEILLDDGMQERSIDEFVDNINTVERGFLKHIHFAKYPGVRPEERLWNMLQLFSLSCYLVLHFRRAIQLCGEPMSDEEAGRTTEQSVLLYLKEPKSKEELDLYFSALEYNHDKQLSENDMRQAQHELVKEVPQSLLLPYLHHVDDAYQMGVEANHCEFTAEEYVKLIAATAKWQILEQNIYLINHPEEMEHSLYNEVFHTVVNGRYVDFEELKSSISKMVALINKKNQWFCAWCVLKHHNLLANFSHEAFARQMMNKDWFGDVPESKRFSGDTLRDYKRYFSEYDYSQWNNERFLEQKLLFGKTKWSDSLCEKFKRLCQEMEQSIMGWKFLRS